MTLPTQELRKAAEDCLQIPDALPDPHKENK